MKKKSLKEIEKNIRSHFNSLESRYFVKKIGIFGSYAKNSQSAKSDIDILVRFSRPVGFFHFIDTKNYLTRILKNKIDLVTPNALKPPIKKRILHQVKYI